MKGVCPECGKLIELREDGELRVHGRRNRRCTGRRLTSPAERVLAAFGPDEKGGDGR